LLPFALRAALRLAALGATVSLSPTTWADESEPPPGSVVDTARSAPIAWSVRLSAGVGLAPVPDGDLGVAGRVGIDGEYWLSKNLGIGAQVGFHAIHSVSIWPSENATTYSEDRISLAPAFAVRGANPTSFPMASLALGYSWGHGTGRDPSGLYGSLTAAWLFHPANVLKGSIVSALGPVVRIDWLTYDNFSRGGGFGFESWGWTLTAGLTIGFGVARDASR
jgi:hypothetical protein